jgi:predicted nicotinamide N-methyase
MRPAVSLEHFAMEGLGRTWRFAAPAEPGDVLHALTDAECALDKRQPYWAERWPSAQVLFEFLAGLDLPPDARVCEIGCGLGVCAALAGAKSRRVAAADISIDACVLTARNSRGNGSTARAVCCDWRRPPFRGRFDLIAGSDILYESGLVDSVAGFIDGSLDAGGVAYIADPCRQFWGDFRRVIGSRGFRVRIANEEIVNKGRTVVEVAEIRRTVPGWKPIGCCVSSTNRALRETPLHEKLPAVAS